MPKAVIIGVGPDRGLGAQLCKRFAGDGLAVVAAGRTQAALDAVVADIERAGGKASAFVADEPSALPNSKVFLRSEQIEGVAGNVSHHGEGQREA